MEASALPRQRATVLPRSQRLLAALGDDRLVDQLRRGNSAAFEAIYDRYYRGILAFCRHMLGTREEAEDALQHTFTSAYTSLAASDREIHLKSWLYTIARNRCLSTLRARREQPAEIDDQPTAGLSDEVQQRADLRELVADLRELPDDQREALVLFELGDLSHAEIASVIGVEPMKVKALVFQARSSLIENRDARSIPCSHIREQLATATGGALRRGPLRRHLKACEGCREYRDDVRAQRRALAAVLPVVPTAGLKETILSAVGFGGGGAGGAGAAAGGAAGGVAFSGSGAAGGGGFFASVGGLGVAKIAVATTLGVGAVAGGGVAVDSVVDDDRGPAGKASQSRAAAGTAGEAKDGRQGPPSTTPASERAGERTADRGAARGRKDERGKKGKGPKEGKGGRDARGGSPGSNGNGGNSGSAPGRAGALTTRGNSGHAPGASGTAPGRTGLRPPRPTPTSRGGGNAGGNSGSAPGGRGTHGGAVPQPATPVRPPVAESTVRGPRTGSPVVPVTPPREALPDGGVLPSE